MNIFKKIIKIKAGEGKMVLTFFFFSFFTVGMGLIAKTARDAYFLSRFEKSTFHYCPECYTRLNIESIHYITWGGCNKKPWKQLRSSKKNALGGEMEKNVLPPLLGETNA